MLISGWCLVGEPGVMRARFTYRVMSRSRVAKGGRLATCGVAHSEVCNDRSGDLCSPQMRVATLLMGSTDLRSVAADLPVRCIVGRKAPFRSSLQPSPGVARVASQIGRTITNHQSPITNHQSRLSRPQPVQVHLAHTLHPREDVIHRLATDPDQLTTNNLRHKVRRQIEDFLQR